jgi:hypothetical protein
MGVFSGPDVSESGLVYSFDANNIKNFPELTSVPAPNEHGYAEWYCFETMTVTYSIDRSGVSIVERQSNGTITTVVSTSSGPTRGTFIVTAGRIYYGVGGPINLVVEDQHHVIVPLTMVGTQFWLASARNSNATCYIYSPYKSATVRFFKNPASAGVSGSSPTSTITLAAGSQTTIAYTAPVNFETVDSIYIWSSEPILVSNNNNGTDKTILSPMTKYVYQRYLTYDATSFQTTPTNRNYGCIYDTTHAVMSQSIADGGGGDCAQGLGLEFLSDRYSWGNVLSDYSITCPYSGTITTSYWNGSAWIVWDTHVITNGSITDPPVINRDGTNGPGVNATNLSGQAANMASGATLWKWEGTVPFYLCINDVADDELSVLGWMNTRVTSKNNRVYLNDTISGERMTITGPQIYNAAGYFSFPTNQTTSYLLLSNFNMPLDDHTISIWFRSFFPTTFQSPFTYSINGNNELLLFTDSSTIIVPHTKDDRFTITVPDMTNKWCNFTRTRIKSTGLERYYMNGVSIGSRVIFANQSITSGGRIIIGQEADQDAFGFDSNQNLDGDFAQLLIYNRELNETEIRQIFNSSRSRFGI